jgi:beta-lactam-binding protein with PASTA domain
VNTVSVLLNRGDGIFHARFGYATGHQPASVAIGDLNADRKPDLATADQDGDTVSVLLYTPGVCRVPNLKGKTLPVAKRTIARAQCRVGRLRRAYSTTVKRGRVVLQKPKPGTLLPKLGLKKINLVVSRGRRPS